MFAKLARRNIRRSARDYLIYFVTVTLAIALMFAFNSILFSDDIQQLSAAIKSMNSVVVIVSVIVVFVVGWLINYITRFTLQKRSREFGTYLILGMEKRALSKMFLLENLVIGAVSFVAGIALGTLLFQIFSAVIFNVFGAPYQIALVFSWKPALLTFAYFIAVYLFSLLRSNRTLRKLKVRDLLDADHRNEKLRLRGGRGLLAVFGCSLLCLAGCLIFVVLFFKTAVDGSSVSMLYLLLGVLLLIAFLYLFYIGLCSFLLFLYQRSGTWKYKKSRLFLVRQTTSKINSNGALMGTLALLLTLTFLSLSTGVLLNGISQSTIAKNAAFDMSILVEDPTVDFTRQIQLAGEYSEVQDAVTYRLYRTGGEEFRRQLEGSQFAASWFGSDLAIRLSDYNRLREQLGHKPAAMSPAGYFLHADREFVADTLTEYAEQLGGIQVGGEQLRYSGTYQEDFSEGSTNGFYFLLVLPDEVCSRLQPYSSNLALKTEDGVPAEAYERMKSLAYSSDAQGTQIVSEWGMVIIQKQDFEQSKSVFTIFSFLSFYLGLVFICVSATILAVQQLSDSAKYRYRFVLLQKLGLSRKEVNKLVLKQLAVYFGLPAACPVVLSTLLLTIANQSLWPMLPGRYIIFSYLLLIFCLFAVVYACYFLACYTGFKQNISSK